MNQSTTIAPAFTPDETMRWLRNDPTMQHREAFTDTITYRIPEYDFMAPYLPVGAEVLLTKVDVSEAITPGGIYYVATTGHREGDSTTIGRLVAVENQKTKGPYPFAWLVMAYENKEAIAKYRGNTDGDGCYYISGWFNGFSPKMESFRQQPNYRVSLWRVSHYVSLPLAQFGHDVELMMNMGMTPDQHKWYRGEQQVADLEAQVVTVEEHHIDYREPVNEVVLNTARAEDLNRFLAEQKPLTASKRKNRKAPVVTITRRSAVGTATQTFDYKAVVVALNMLDAQRRDEEMAEKLRHANFQKAQDKYVAQAMSQHRPNAVPASVLTATAQVGQSYALAA